MPDFNDAFLRQEYYGQSVADYAWFVGIVLGTLLLKRPIANLLTRLSGRIASRLNYSQYRLEIRDMLLKPVERLLEVVLLGVAFNQVSDAMDRIVVYHSISKTGKTVVKLGDLVEHTILFLFILFAASVVTRVIDLVFLFRIRKAQDEKDLSRLQLSPLFREMSRLATWLAGTFWALGSVFHVNVPALITGLGIGGVAIALAGKETVENIFAAFTILSDKPFQVGESIKLGDVEGTVERIGFRSTRVRAADGSELVLPNQKLVSQQVINLTTRTTQVLKLLFAIKHGTSPGDLNRMVATLTDKVLLFPAVMGAPDISIDMQKPEAVMLKVDVRFPFPLPDHGDIVACRRALVLELYDVVRAHAQPGGSLDLMHLPS